MTDTPDTSPAATPEKAEGAISRFFRETEVDTRLLGMLAAIWVLAILAGLLVGTLIGGFQGYMIAYGTIPAFIVTLGGLLVWRGVGFLVARGETIAPVDATFKLLGGGPYGAVGNTGSWIVGILGCIAVLALIILGRRKRKSFDLHLRPVWAEGFLAAVGCGAVIGATMLVNAYPWPKGIVKKYAEAEGIEVPPEGIFISHGFAIPVRRAGRHQHPLDDRQNLRADGLSDRPLCRRRIRPSGLRHGRTWHAGRALRHRGGCHWRHVTGRRGRHHLRRNPWGHRHAILADRHGAHRL